jgi:hypothetical protein
MSDDDVARYLLAARRMLNPPWPVRQWRRVRRLWACRRCVLGHRWVYFIDGSIARYCTRCPRRQYDLNEGGRSR